MMADPLPVAVGDPDPTAGTPEQYQCGQSNREDCWACTRSEGHRGWQHIAGTGRVVVAVWPWEGE